MEEVTCRNEDFIALYGHDSKENNQSEGSYCLITSTTHGRIEMKSDLMLNTDCAENTDCEKGGQL